MLIQHQVRDHKYRRPLLGMDLRTAGEVSVRTVQASVDIWVCFVLEKKNT